VIVGGSLGDPGVEKYLSSCESKATASGSTTPTVVTVRARIQTGSDYAPIVPLVIPELEQVRAFAARLHAEGKPWQGEAFGWPAEYNPQRPEAPLDSKMTFTPADFCIGESGIWFFSPMWERGRDQQPNEFLDDRNIVSRIG
jgi:hypothetical protein